MRIVLLTPGAGNFHCGSCLRDHALVKGLRELGHDVSMLALYLPHVLDEPDQQPREVFFGGVNVYLQQKSRLFRHTPRWLDAWLDAPWLLRLAAQRAGMTQARELGELTLSMLRGEEGNQLKELTRLVEHLRIHDQPDLIILSNALLVGLARQLKQTLGVPLLCTLHGEDGFLDSLPDSHRQACWDTLAARADDIACFVPVSRYYAQVMASRLKLPEQRVRVIHNGIDADQFPLPKSASPSSPAIGYLARFCPPKGLHMLVDAFILLKATGRYPELQLHLAGAQTNADDAYVRQQQRKLADAKLTSCVRWRPNVDAAGKLAFLHGLSVLSVPATYGEAFGLYVLEALACGVPVVQPDSGAFGELLGHTGGGILCRPNDPPALALALAEVLDDSALRTRLGQQGQQAVREHFTHQRMARQVESLCRELCP